MNDRPHKGPAPLSGSKPRKDRSWRFYAAIVVLIVALVFIAQNSQKVPVDFIISTTTAPLFFVLLVTFILGALTGWLLPRVRGGRRDDKKD